MKKIFLFLVFALVLVGCGMTNDEIISEIRKCEDAGLISKAYKGDFNGVYKVVCFTEKEYELRYQRDEN